MSHEYALKDVPLVRIMIKWLNLSFRSEERRVGKECRP